MKLNDDGVKAPAVKRAVEKLEVPPHVLKVLRGNKKALSNFQKMSPSQQRDYVEWIVEAKREETKTKRLATMLKWLEEGKSRNWKYEKC